MNDLRQVQSNQSHSAEKPSAIAKYALGSGTDLRLVSDEFPMTPGPVIRFPRASLARRLLAAAIDRVVPLPLIAWFVPGWLVVVVGYHLLCDSSPNRRSLGKWICRLRVVALTEGGDCERWQTIVRRIGVAAGQVAYCWSYELMLIAFACDLIGLAAIVLSAEGRRGEDLIAGTQVVNESTFQRLRRAAIRR